MLEAEKFAFIQANIPHQDSTEISLYHFSLACFRAVNNRKGDVRLYLLSQPQTCTVHSPAMKSKSTLSVNCLAKFWHYNISPKPNVN